MIRDFQSFGGNLPGEIFEQIGDYQPWSLAAPSRYKFPEAVRRAGLRTIQTVTSREAAR